MPFYMNLESEKQMKKFKKICVGAASLAVLFASTSAFAFEDYTLTTPLTEEYIKWQSLSEEEKKQTIIPRVSTVDISSSLDSEKTSGYSGLRERVLTGRFVKSAKSALVGANGYQLSKFNLNDQISVEVKHQGETNECWAFSMTSVLETNLLLTQNITKKFSPRHMDYSLIRTFTDGINSDSLNREAGMGGLAQFAVAYLTNGKGAVLESQMPFVNNKQKISLTELNKPVDTIVTETVTFPALYKRYADGGEVVYTNGATGSDLKIYETNEVKALRNTIKDHIVKYGAVSAVTAGNEKKYYSNPANPAKSVAYFCNDSSIQRDHAITIVGWDDNYSKDNFTGAAKPSSNGAYICLNSYGTNNFANGYLYISYEDSLIETYLYGIKSATTVDYNKIYQYNPNGENTSVGISGISKGYIAEIFKRDVSTKETLKYVGVNLPSSMSLKIYVNPTGNNPVLSACKLVATTETLNAGYHRIPIKATNLTGNTFTVVIEETSTDNRFEFSMEIAVNGSIYSTITGNPGKSLYSVNGYGWSALSSEQVEGFDMTTADMTIKAFTVDGYIENANPVGEKEQDEKPENKPEEKPTTPEESNESEEPKESEEQKESDKITITSTAYTIKGTDIYRVVYDTTIEKFKKNIKTNSEKLEFYDSENKKMDDTAIIKNGTKLKLSDGSSYTLIVRGDTNCDGEISLVDLSKMVAHYGDQNKYGLTGNSLKAADLNVDGKVSLIDISQIVDLLGHMQN